MFNVLLADFNAIYLLFCIREQVAMIVISTSKINYYIVQDFLKTMCFEI